MSREEAKQLLIDMGTAEPTSEQIDKLLNGIGKNAKAKDDLIDRSKAKIAELETQLEEKTKILEEKDNANLSDMEKLQKELEALKADNAKQIQANKDMQMRADLAKQGIVDEDAEKIIESVKSGSFDAETIGKIIADREAKAVSAKEQELLKGTKSPDGGTDGDNKSTAENLVKGMYGGQTQNNTVLSNYL